MKLKEARLCCAFAWNPRDSAGDQLMLAAGSIAGAMDDNFSSEAHLEIRKVDLSNTSSNDLPVIGRVVMPDRAHRVHWSSHGGTNGMIAAGLVDGTVKVWSADKMLETYDGSADLADNAINDDPFGNNGPLPAANVGGSDVDPEAATLCVISAHQGGVRGLQFNPTRRDLLATGGGDRELCIWSLTDPTNPMKVPTPPKSTHPGEITDLRWNVKFEHIIGTTTTAGTFSLWDLRSLRQTQQISGQQGAATTLAWHPEGLTQVAIARDGVNPVVQIWDLKKANAPIKELRGHTGGVVGLGWCHDDSNLLFSAGCDGRTICWNPNSGELVGELAPQNNWVTDVAWCPRIPAIVATSSFDSTLAVHAAQDVSGSNATGTATLPKAVPKWLNRPCSAAFGFGGRIVRLSKTPSANGGPNTTLEVITKAKDVSGEEAAFHEEFKANSANPEWIAEKGYKDIAALASSNQQGNREAVLDFLGVNPTAVAEELQKAADSFGESEEDTDTLVARCVASGKLTEAVNVCLAANRYDDAFAIAYIRGTDEVTRVHQAYVAHKSAKAAESGAGRFATYVGAIATKDLSKLKAAVVEDKSINWREALAVLTSFLPPQNFSAAASDLGAGLQSKGDAEGAASCFIVAGSVDAAARLWYTRKSLAEFIRATEILEAVVKAECRDKVFVDALASYADQLAKAGDYKSALRFAARAARLGSMEGAVVADLCQSMVAPAERLDIRFPFAPIQIPDSRIPMVQQIAAMQQPVQRRVDPAAMPQQQQQQQMGGGPRPQFSTNAPQHPSMPQNTMMNNNNMGRNPAMPPGPNNGMPPMNNGMPPMNNNMPPPQGGNFNNNNMGGPRPPMPGPNGMPPGPGPNNGPQMNNGMPPANMNRPPMPGPNGMPPLTNNFAPPPGPGAIPTPNPNNGMPLMNNGMPPMNTNMPPPQGGNFNNAMPPPPPAAPVNAMPPPPPAAAPAPMPLVNAMPAPSAPPQPESFASPSAPMARPASLVAATYGGPSAAPMNGGSSATAPLAGSSSVVFTFDISTIPSPEGQTIANGIITAANAIKDKRKRDAIEKAALELFSRLQRGEVSQSCLELLVVYVAALGTPAAKDAWRKISDAHFSEIGPYLHLKFL